MNEVETQPSIPSTVTRTQVVPSWPSRWTGIAGHLQHRALRQDIRRRITVGPWADPDIHLGGRDIHGIGSRERREKRKGAEKGRKKIW